MSFPHSSTTRPDQIEAESTARVLLAIGRTFSRRASVDLPGLADAYESRVVIIADGTQLTGALGSYAAQAWADGLSTFDKITLNVRHPVVQHPRPLVYAERVLTVLTHELVHLYTSTTELVGTTGPGRVRHTEDFARLAIRIGLHVDRRPYLPAGLVTPSLTMTARIRNRDLLNRIVALNLGGVRGIGLAGPTGFTGTLPSAPSGAFAPRSSSSFLSANPNSER